MNKLALLPLLALVLTLGLGNIAYAEFGDHDITKDKNISESPAIADRKISPLNEYGYETMKSVVCGDHLCANGEEPPTLTVWGDYSRGD